MYNKKEYYVKYKDDQGFPYAVQATSIEQAARKLVKMSPCTSDAIVLVYTSKNPEIEPYEFYVDELE